MGDTADGVVTGADGCAPVSARRTLRSLVLLDASLATVVECVVGALAWAVYPRTRVAGHRFEVYPLWYARDCFRMAVAPGASSGSRLRPSSRA